MFFQRVLGKVYGSGFACLQVFAEKMGLETGWNCHISLTPNGDSPCDGAPSSPSHGSLHEDLNQGSKSVFVQTQINIHCVNPYLKMSQKKQNSVAFSSSVIEATLGSTIIVHPNVRPSCGCSVAF